MARSNKIKNQATFSQLNNMTKKELYEYVSSKYEIGNDRLTELEEVDTNTSAYRYIRKKAFQSHTGVDKIGDFTVFKTPSMRMSRDELLAEAQNLTGFLNARTSTIKGRDEMYQEAVDTINQKSHGKTHLTVEQAQDIFTSKVFQDYTEKANMSTVILEVFSQNLDNGRSFEYIERVLQRYFDNRSKDGSDITLTSFKKYVWGRHLRHSSKETE